MVLLIVPEMSDDVIREAPANTKVLDYKSFNMIETHPFIVTNKWERIDIVISKGLRSGYIKQILSVGFIVNAILFDEQNIDDYEIVCRLIEIYPNLANELRRTYMSRQSIRPILEREGVRFERGLS